MKVIIYFSIGICLFIGLTACKKNSEVGPNDTSTVEPFLQKPNLPDYQPFSGVSDFFVDLPLTFPESGTYRVSGIDIKTVTGEKAILSVRFSYYLASGRLAYKLYQDYRYYFNTGYTSGYPTWRQNYVFDAQNHLLNEASVTSEGVYGLYTAGDITYDYEHDVLKKITGKGKAGGSPLNLVTTYRYENNRRIGATILNYYYGSALSNLEFPWDSTRRKFVYSNNNQTIVEQDSSWYVPCFPNIPCINKFMNIDSTRRQYDAKGNLLSIRTTLNSPLYPEGAATFRYEYNGPHGLLSRLVNTDAGLIYQFRYLEK